MNFFVPAWSADYAHDRRKHRHRCQCCKRIVNAGEQVFVAKIKTKKTRVVHDQCADKVAISDVTWRELLKAQAFQYQLRCFGMDQYNQDHWPKIEKYRAASGIRADIL